MRNQFARSMTELAGIRDDLCLLSGDIGNRMFDQFKNVATERFINCGIAEANMMSMAVGMAMSGMRPVVYTIAPFTTTRCFEQIRTGVGYHNVPVTIVGTGSGLSYSELGATHHSLEDIAIMRTIPGMKVCAPCDAMELDVMLRDTFNYDGPTYIRIGKKGEPQIHKKKQKLGIGKSQIICEGDEIAILSAGPIISEALKAKRELSNKNVCIANIGSINPLDHDFLEALISKGYKKWITLEEHYKRGGLGSAILEWLHETNNKNINLDIIGVENHFIHTLGSQEYIREKEGIDSKSIIRRVEII